MSYLLVRHEHLAADQLAVLLLADAIIDQHQLARACQRRILGKRTATASARLLLLFRSEIAKHRAKPRSQKRDALKPSAASLP